MEGSEIPKGFIEVEGAVEPGEPIQYMLVRVSEISMVWQSSFCPDKETGMMATGISAGTTWRTTRLSYDEVKQLIREAQEES